MPDETAADRVMRAVADSIDLARRRTERDGTDPAVPVAATVLLLRDGDGGLEVLLIERPDRGSFAGAWVFPGGKLEDADRDAAGGAEEDAARNAGARETREETGLVLDPATLVPLSRWDPPPGIALRIRTWFFAVEAPGGELALAAEEAVAAEWVNPADILARHGRGEVTLYPPTWVTLHGLTGHTGAESVLAEARFAGAERFETVARRGAEGPLLVWQGDAAYDTDAGDEASGQRHRLEIGALPWRYTRSG